MAVATLALLPKVMEAAEVEEVLVVLVVEDAAAAQVTVEEVDEVDEAEVTVFKEAETTTAIMMGQEADEAAEGGLVVLQELVGPRVLLHRPLVDERRRVVAHLERQALLKIWMMKVGDICYFYNCLPFTQFVLHFPDFFAPPPAAPPPKPKSAAAKSTAAKPAQASASTSTTRAASNRNMTANNSEEVRCDCGEIAIERTVTKESINKGRTFRKCGTEKCSFFAWGDEPVASSSTSTSAATRRTDSMPAPVIPAKRAFSERSVSR